MHRIITSLVNKEEENEIERVVASERVIKSGREAIEREREREIKKRPCNQSYIRVQKRRPRSNENNRSENRAVRVGKLRLQSSL
jgi:hypothetical protein